LLNFNTFKKMKSGKILFSVMAILAVGLSIIGFSEFAITQDIADFLFGASGASGVTTATFAWPVTGKVGYKDGDENMGGFGIVAYLGLYDDIEEWPVPGSFDEANSLEDLVSTTGDFVMIEGKKFLKVFVAPETLNLNPEGQGEPGGRSFKPTCEFVLPGYSAQNRGLARKLNNARGCIIIPDDKGTFRHLVGTENRPAFFKPTGSSGTKPADLKGFTYSVDCSQFAPSFDYNGPIPLTSETLPAIS
jgi:hypothetical protein